MAFFRTKKNYENATVKERFSMVTERGNGFYAWNGKLYESDMVRSCIRPLSLAIGKMQATHVRKDSDGTIKKNPEAYMRMLLEEPNPFMSGQVMQEKASNQLELNRNAFILIVRDPFGVPIELYHIPATVADAIYQGYELYLKFYYQNGKT